MKRLLFLFTLLLLAAAVSADEGMWMAGRISRRMAREMRAKGLAIPLNEVYSEKDVSLKDAIVSFGGFCSGVVVSESGLVFTNHHCGFESVQQNSTLENNYLVDGFSAATLKDELPCRGLYVRFLVRTENVTKRVLRHVKARMSEDERTAVIDEASDAICEEVASEDSTLVGVVDSYYGGNEYWLSVYRDYDDVRLVFAPPLSVGKFGGDTDNWEWPRHTGDFCVFRIYAGEDNRPAEYADSNVPYRPVRYAPVSLAGYDEGDYSMTIGYPGATQRYLSSYGVEEMMECSNAACIDLYTVKLSQMKSAMDADTETYIKYASKFENDANVMKSCEEQNRSIKRLGVLKTKRDYEYIMARDTALATVLKDLKANYEKRRRTKRAMAYYEQAFFGGAELPIIAMDILNGDYAPDEKSSEALAYKVAQQYADYDPQLDRKVFVSMAEGYRRSVDKEYLPVFYQEVDSLFGGDIQAYAESLFSNSHFTSMEGMVEALSDTTFVAIDDAASNLAMELLFNYFTMNAEIMNENDVIARGERILAQAMRANPISAPENYPDANMTMRLSYGTVGGYSPRDGVDYNFFTTTRGILEKAREYSGNPEFSIKPELAELLTNRNSFASYSDGNGDMRVCFVTDNDITGGNSGSAMFNGRGELIGLAFDGNSDDMSGDVMYNKRLQRCIGVDIRYVLYIIEKYGKATRLLDELKLSR
jgi:hypothetical protein